jgi:putative transposase
VSLAETYPVRVVCGVLNLPRSSFYYQPAPSAAADTLLRSALQRLAAEWPTYGYRRLTAHLHRAGFVVNSKRVRRLMAELGLLSHPPVRRVRTTNSNHPFPRYPNLVQGRVARQPDAIWVAEIV